VNGRALWLDLPDGRIEAAWWGDGNAVIVLLHEGLGCVALWRDLPEWLAATLRCRVFAYSRFGYGQSDPRPLPWPLNYMHDEALRVLPQVLQAAGIERALLLGHSDGGSIATIHAGAAADPRATALVLIAPHFFVEPAGLQAIRMIGAEYRDGPLRERLARYHRNVDVAFRGWHDAWTAPGFAAFDLTAELAAVRVPILALQGADDAYGTAAQLDAITRHATVPTETLLIPGARHAPHLEAPDATRAAIAGFIARATSAGSMDRRRAAGEL
jgi:pimeloyl-ACP methyl ester carboxylesterase